MKRWILPVVVVLVVSLGVFFVSCDNGETLQNLLEIAQANEDLESLVNVILYIDEHSTFDPEVAATLADETESATVFAPDNDAFVAVFGDIDGDGVVELEDIQAYRDGNGFTDAEAANALLVVLAYHVIFDQILMASDVIAADGSSIGPTDAGVLLDVTVAGDQVTLNPQDGSSGATITQTDIEASNGVAHIIDAVMGLFP